ncbi:cytochrome c-type biogenesis protein [Methylomonas sp. AM2-LC]|uniref:cytochrome c-type biogenesis protein n=1 Tax=Methylomonas sp. AM2-LC TaxID=3153301 RepID=UPI003266450F
MKFVMVLLLFSYAALASAVVEYHDFKQPEQEQIYLNLIKELRCLVCQNQTIADSNADLAKDLRRQVYEMVQKGQSKSQIVDYMTERYGDFVLYRPLFNEKTALLWLGPAVFLLGGLVTVLLIIKRRNKQATASELNAEQQSRVQKLLEKGDQE